MPKLKNISQELSNPNIERISLQVSNQRVDIINNFKFKKNQRMMITIIQKIGLKKVNNSYYQSKNIIHLDYINKQLNGMIKNYINPQYIDSLNVKGDCLGQLGQYKSAIERYDKALAINPQFAHSLMVKVQLIQLFNGVCLSSLCQYEQAIEWFDKAFKINPSRTNIDLFQHCHQHVSN
ncbi:unnamed protein product [Paramecium octaurelia]|uniref:Tetratricopeptide repeat protein n=1 Tax=Paramecium octaurelia TaxID=43137 RepID=A0A8S1SVF4_PAROT|nr:unnamed protein product [Paramecium octaurelia]